MNKGALLRCFSFSLVLATITAVKVLKDIKDLKENTKFGRKFPQHGLMLLHWFASNINIDQKQVIRLKFNPTLEMFGVHKFHNKERAVPLISSSVDLVYYTMGDLSRRSAASQLPTYVTQDYNNLKYNQNSDLQSSSYTDRLIIRVHSSNLDKVDEVYVSQHYDPANTYRVSLKLLKQIQALSREGTDSTCDPDEPRRLLHPCDYLVNAQKVEDLQMTYPPTPGLVWFMTLAGYDTNNRVSQYSHTLFCLSNGVHGNIHSTDPKPKCEAHNKLKLEVKSTSNGYAKILWSGIPENIVKKKSSVGLYKDQQLQKAYPLDGRTFGTIDTKTALNPGLQVKLTTTNDKLIWVGPEFDEANGAPPTKLKGFDASLQLYTKDGYACARLFVKKTFSNWDSVFQKSWVGFYKSSQDDNKIYKTYQNSMAFEKGSDEGFSEDYRIFEYKSSLAVGPGVQARFLLDQGYENEKARTEPWDGVINPDTHDELQKK